MGATYTEVPVSQESQEYFSLINQKLQNTKAKPREDLSTTKPQSSWKQTIIKHLLKQSNLGIVWAKNLQLKLNKTPFLSEKKYLDLFYWQKFELRNKPRCLNQANGEQSLNMTMNYSSITNMTDLSTSEYEMNKEKLKEYIQIFKEHLKSPDHPIAICIAKFITCFTEEYNNHFKEINDYPLNANEKNERAQLVADALTQQLVKFIFKLQKCFGVLYSKVLTQKYFEEEKEEFITMITSEFFKNKSLYLLIMALYRLAHKEELDAFQSKCNKMINVTPSILGVNQKFCLDHITEDYQLDFIYMTNITLPEDKKAYLKSRYKNKNEYPYNTSLSLLKTIKMYQTPFDKITLLASISSDVIENVTNTWKPLEEYMPKNFLSIDGDELIILFSYIIVKAQIPDLLIHLKFINNFTTSDTKSSMIGYYYTTMEASIININGFTIPSSLLADNDSNSHSNSITVKVASINDGFVDGEEEIT